MLSDDALLRVGFLLEAPERLDAIFAELSDERIDALVALAAREDRWTELMGITDELGQAQQRRMAALLSAARRRRGPTLAELRRAQVARLPVAVQLARARRVDRPLRGGAEADEPGQRDVRLADRAVGDLHLAGEPRRREAALDRRRAVDREHQRVLGAGDAGDRRRAGLVDRARAPPARTPSSRWSEAA